MEDVGVIAVEAECIAEDVLEAVNDKTSIVTFSLGSGKAGDVIMSFVADVMKPVRRKSHRSTPMPLARSAGCTGRSTKNVSPRSGFSQGSRCRNFPYAETNISMHDGEREKFLEELDKWVPTHQ